MHRALKVALPLLVALGAAGGGAAYYRKKSRHRTDLKTITVERKGISHSLHLAGKVIPISSLVITPRQSGRIITITVQVPGKEGRGRHRQRDRCRDRLGPPRLSAA